MSVGLEVSCRELKSRPHNFLSLDLCRSKVKCESYIKNRLKNQTAWVRVFYNYDKVLS